MKLPLHQTRNRGLPRLARTVIACAFLTAAVAVIGPATASAATFTVNSPADTNDALCDVADCTLREAIFAANASGVADTIEFLISGTIALTSDLPALLSLDTIDGSTASGYTVGNPTIEIDGSAGGVTLGIALGSNSALNAVVVNGVSSGRGVQLNSNNVVTGCFIGTNLAGTAADMNFTGVYVGGSGNTIGGSTIASRNVISGNFDSGIDIVWASPTNLVVGNYIGTNAAGTGAVANNSDGVRMTANSQIGSTGDPPNVISGNVDDGIVVGSAVTSGIIENNLIGTDASGDGALANAGTGVEVVTGAEVVIGGAAPGAGNVISGNAVAGITLDNATTTIQRNRIGTSDGGGTALGNNVGIFTTGGADNNVIGSGTDPSLGNTIAFSPAGGIKLDPTTGSGNDLRGNSIHGNGGTFGWIGIDIGADAITPNDLGDGDSGANDIQNFPLISQATLLPQTNQITVSGTLNAQPSATYAIELYANPACSATGAGEGAIVLGSQAVNTDGAGDAPFTAQLASPPAGNYVISATSTNASGSTSEFSSCVTASSPTTPPQPVPGEKIVVEPVSGKVLVKLPGTNLYVPLEEVETIPVGSIVDAREGRVKLTTAAKDGTSSAVFYKGRFKVTQSRAGDLLTNLKIINDTNKCSSTSRASIHRGSIAKKKKKKKKKGELWGDGDGNYRTTGDNGSATVRGTNWQTVNRCDGTLFFVKRGKVQVRDFNRKKTITLKQGKKYLAKAK